jgi:predicted permease
VLEPLWLSATGCVLGFVVGSTVGLLVALLIGSALQPADDGPRCWTCIEAGNNTTGAGVIVLSAFIVGILFAVLAAWRIFRLSRRTTDTRGASITLATVGFIGAYVPASVLFTTVLPAVHERGSHAVSMLLAFLVAGLAAARVFRLRHSARPAPSTTPTS